MFDNFILRKTDKGNIAGYLWHVDDPAAVVCIIHGIAEYAGRYERIARAFNARNIAVVSMDHRGHGLSMNKKGHCAPRKDVLDDVTAMIQYAQTKYPGKPLIVYGHSMGGNIGLDYKYRGELNDAAAGYIITGPWLRLVRSTPKPLVALVKAGVKIAPTLTISAGVDQSKLGHPESVAAFTNPEMLHNKISIATALDGMLIGEAIEKGTMETNGKGEDIPMLLMHGSDDFICDVKGTRAFAARLKEEGRPCEYVEWHGFFHEVHNGGPKSLGDEVIEKAVSWVENLIK